MVGKGVNVGHGVEVRTAVVVAVGDIEVGVDDEGGTTIAVSVGLGEREAVDEGEDVIRGIVVCVGLPVWVAKLLSPSVTGSDMVQLDKLNITINNAIIDQ